MARRQIRHTTEHKANLINCKHRYRSVLSYKKAIWHMIHQIIPLSCPQPISRFQHMRSKNIVTSISCKLIGSALFFIVVLLDVVVTLELSCR